MSESRSSSGTRPDVRDEDARQQRLAAGQVDRDDRAGAVGLAEQRQRQLVGVEDRVGLLLPALAGQRLLEVAVAVEQAHADDRDAQVGGGLEVVAGQDAEAAGVLRQDGGDAVLGREVGDRAGRVGAGLAGVPALAVQVVLERLGRDPQPLEERRVAGQLVEPLAPHGAEQAHRVVVDVGPQPLVDRPEDVLRLRVPGPAQVAGQGGQAGQRLGQDRTDGESSDRSHGPTVGHFFDRSKKPPSNPGHPRGGPRETRGGSGLRETPGFASVGAWLDAYPSWTSPPSSTSAARRPRPPSASRCPSARRCSARGTTS